MEEIMATSDFLNCCKNSWGKSKAYRKRKAAFRKLRSIFKKGKMILNIGIVGTAVLFSLAFPSFKTDTVLYAQTKNEKQPNEHLLGYKKINYPFEVRGRRYYDIEYLKDGEIKITNYEKDKILEVSYYIILDLAKNGVPEQDAKRLSWENIKLIVFTHDEKYSMAYIFFEREVLLFGIDKRHSTALEYHRTSDRSKFFLGENQMYVRGDCIFALTPTEFFYADSKNISSGKLGVKKPLENPIIVKGEKKNVFFIRDKNLEEDMEVEIED